MKFTVTLLLIFSCYLTTAAQSSITGIVNDDKEFIPGAAVYLAGTKISTVTNSEGKFSINNLAAGNYDILIQVVGYLPFSQNILITDKSVYLVAKLKEAPISLKEIIIKPDPDRLYHLQTFRKLFIGTTPNAAQCKILNLEVLRTHFDNKEGLLTVNSDEFLVIENQALGYRIKYLLKYFDFNVKTGMMFYAGYPFFEEMKGSRSRQIRWQKNRNIAYYGSSMHFFKSLYKRKINEEGFLLHKLITIPNQNRKPDSLINTNIKRLTSGVNAINTISFAKGDSLSYWLNERKKPTTVSILNKANIKQDTLVKEVNGDLKSIAFTDELFVVYTKEQEPKLFNHTNFYVNRSAEYNKAQISLLSLLDDKISFFKNGLALNTRGFVNKGFWAFEKMADAVPSEFEPNP